MQFNNSIIIVIIVMFVAFFLIYNHMCQPKYIPYPVNNPQVNQVAPFTSNLEQTTDNSTVSSPCPNCEFYKKQLYHQPTSITLDTNNDPYSDPIKKQDLYSIDDPLTYPQLRLPRDILEKYNEYYKLTGSQLPFNQATQPLFDNPILNGFLTKMIDDNEPFNDNVPSTVPLFRSKSYKNTNRYFYYILDQRYQSKIELKIPLTNIKINGSRHNNSDFYGLPELYDGDIIENIPGYSNTKFKVNLYKQFHFP